MTARTLSRMTGASVRDCLRALVESNGDEVRAVEWLRRHLRCGEHRREEE